jgi:hypothetical protein
MRNQNIGIEQQSEGISLDNQTILSHPHHLVETMAIDMEVTEVVMGIRRLSYLSSRQRMESKKTTLGTAY